MNKVIKGTIAVAAGVALFGGGIGSLAYWQSTQEVGTTYIGTAPFSFIANGEQRFINGEQVTQTELLARGFAPGDEIVISQFIDLFVTTPAQLTIAPLEFNSNSPAAAEALEAALDITVEPVSNDTTYMQFTPTADPLVYTVNGSYTGRVNITLVWPENSTDQTAANQIIQFGPSDLTLTQLPRTSAPEPEDG
ncbi:hypothetical protein AB0N73_11750 [Microbacterium sp. NPDC089189]|uniref:hypothetical protein n=1 Tax=Microbacterium sp. NPDC089189 TaxID=3154972 RepID=UPI00344A1841